MGTQPPATGRDAATPQPCPHAPLCVGCPYIGLRYTEQLARKRARVVAALAERAPAVTVEVDQVVGSQRLFSYRNQVKLVARRSPRGFVLGVYKPGTHEVVDVSQCPVHDALVARALDVVKRCVEREEVPIYDEETGHGWLRYVAVRSSWMRKTTQVVPVVRDREWSGEKRFVDRLRRGRGIGSVVLNVNDSPGNTIFSDRFVSCTRHDTLVERVGVLKLKLRAGSFVQANLSAARRAYEKVAQLANATDGETAIDLYCGVGAISLLLACSAGSVFGIESSASAVRDAIDNTRLNGIHNARFRAGDATELLPELNAELPQVDLVTLNPPRKGATAALLQSIVSAAPSRIVYMSCNPETLARDLQVLALAGYETRSVHPFDFLPQTEHIECVALLVRA